MLIRFIIGGLMYMGIEVMYDGTSHRSMGLVGGLAFVICGAIDNFIPSIPFVLNCIIIGLIITIMEYIAGRIWNKDYSIWDYRKMPFNLHGQICLLFFGIWVLLAPFIILLDEILRKII